MKMKIAVLKTLNKEFDVYQFRVCTCVRAYVYIIVNVKYIAYFIHLKVFCLFHSLLFLVSSYFAHSKVYYFSFITIINN